MKFLVLSFLFMFSFNALTQDCKEINLITEKESPFQKIPLYDQDSFNACYAYAAAQLMDYYLIKNKKRDESTISPLWVGLKYASSIPDKDTIGGGSARDAIEATRKAGNCDVKQANKKIREFAKEANIREEELINILEQYTFAMKRNTAHLPLENKSALNPKFQKQVLHSKSFDEAVTKHNPNYCPSSPEFEELEKNLKSYMKYPMKYMITKLTQLDCPELPEKYIVPRTLNVLLKTDADVEKKLIEQLTNNRIPAGISYCSALWLNPKFNGVQYRKMNGDSKTREDCGVHASIVAGMKPVNNQCHFLVRNSWGTRFSKYTEKWKCVCKNKKTKAYVDNCTNKTHNNGEYSLEACWVPSDILSKNMYGMQVFLEK